MEYHDHETYTGQKTKITTQDGDRFVAGIQENRQNYSTFSKSGCGLLNVRSYFRTIGQL